MLDTLGINQTKEKLSIFIIQGTAIIENDCAHRVYVNIRQ